MAPLSGARIQGLLGLCRQLFRRAIGWNSEVWVLDIDTDQRRGHPADHRSIARPETSNQTSGSDRSRAVSKGSQIKEAQACLQGTANNTAQDESAGCAPRSSARTTASFQHRVWCLVSQPRMPITTAS